jgi:hypothetical protein
VSEREVQHEPQVLVGEDEIPRQPADRTDYVPEPGVGRARLPLVIGLVAFLAVVAAIVIWALVS